jgi:hypothetical protein
MIDGIYGDLFYFWIIIPSIGKYFTYVHEAINNVAYWFSKLIILFRKDTATVLRIDKKDRSSEEEVGVCWDKMNKAYILGVKYLKRDNLTPTPLLVQGEGRNLPTGRGRVRWAKHKFQN